MFFHIIRQQKSKINAFYLVLSTFITTFAAEK